MPDKLRNFIKTTLLLPSTVKKNILSINDWPDELKKEVKAFYERYHLKEKKILQDVDKKKLRFYLDSLKKIEEDYRKKEINYLKNLEEILNKLD